jgi:hypothetical protein
MTQTIRQEFGVSMVTHFGSQKPVDFIASYLERLGVTDSVDNPLDVIGRT